MPFNVASRDLVEAAVQTAVASCPPDLLSTRFRGSCQRVIAHPDPPQAAGELTRSETDKKIAGVAGGMAQGWL
jgi:hypothetical protein